MCDYSLHGVSSRPAKVGDKLVTTQFWNTSTRGFSAADEPRVAVCLLPGTEVAFAEQGRAPSYRVPAIPQKDEGPTSPSGTIPSGEHGQSLHASRCAGVSRRTGRVAHASPCRPAGRPCCSSRPSQRRRMRCSLQRKLRHHPLLQSGSPRRAEAQSKRAASAYALAAWLFPSTGV